MPSIAKMIQIESIKAKMLKPGMKVLNYGIAREVLAYDSFVSVRFMADQSEMHVCTDCDFQLYDILICEVHNIQSLIWEK